VFAPLPLKVRLLPLQMVAEGEAVMVSVGSRFTVTVRDCVFVHPLELVPVTVYAVVVVGLAITVAPVVAFNPADGDHE
jgi:hypothetical protein